MKKKPNALKIAIGIPMFCLGITMWIIDPTFLSGFWDYMNYILFAVFSTATGLLLLDF